MTNRTNAIIKSADLSNEDYSCLSAWVVLDYGGAEQAFGGYALYTPPSSKHHKLESTAGHFIDRVLRIAGVSNWSHLPGKSIRVARDDTGLIQGIGHITDDDWFYPKEDFKDT